MSSAPGTPQTPYTPTTPTSPNGKKWIQEYLQMRSLPFEDIPRIPSGTTGVSQGWPSGLMGEKTTLYLHDLVQVTKVSEIIKDAMEGEKSWKEKYGKAWPQNKTPAWEFWSHVANECKSGKGLYASEYARHYPVASTASPPTTPQPQRSPAPAPAPAPAAATASPPKTPQPQRSPAPAPAAAPAPKSQSSMDEDARDREMEMLLRDERKRRGMDGMGNIAAPQAAAKSQSNDSRDVVVAVSDDRVAQHAQPQTPRATQQPSNCCTPDDPWVQWTNWSTMKKDQKLCIIFSLILALILVILLAQLAKT